jgi:hypothetical protein
MSKNSALLRCITTPYLQQVALKNCLQLCAETPPRIDAHLWCFSSLAVLLGASAMPLMAAQPAADLLRAPGVLIGKQIALDDGTLLTPQGVESFTRGARLNQSLLRRSASFCPASWRHVQSLQTNWPGR